MKRFRRISLRALLVVMILLAVGLGVYANRVHRQRDAVRKLEDMGAQIVMDDGVSPQSRVRWPHLVDAHWYRAVERVDLYQLPMDPPPDLLACLADLPHLKSIAFRQGPLRDIDLWHMRHLTNVEQFELWNYGGWLTPEEADVDAETFGVEPNQPRYRHRVTDAGLKHLSGWTRLRKLTLRYTPITDAGLVHLKHLQLEVLDLGGTHVTEAGLAAFDRRPDHVELPASATSLEE
jgi:hypothetical protein